MIKHITQHLLAGFATIIPLAVFIFFISYLEQLFSGLGIRNWTFYFPGLGILLALLVLYLVGITTTTLLGKVFIKTVDRVLHKMPLLGGFYKTMKETLGYSNGKSKLFKESVLVKDKGNNIEELGFVTNNFTEPDGTKKLVVFIPNAPNPSNGRLIFIEESKATITDKTTQETFKTLISVGK